MSNVKTYGEVEPGVLEQVQNCLTTEGSRAVLCADNHLGYSQPIGAAVAYPEHISPTGVGYDIGCGNKAVRTDLFVADVDMPCLMDEIIQKVSFGVGRSTKEAVDHPVLDKIKESGVKIQRELYDTAAKQLGTVGAGNHYVDIFEDSQGILWIGVHFGSRGFGWKTADHYMNMAENDGVAPVLFDVNSELGREYIYAMNLAGEYAYAGRDEVCETILNILGAKPTKEVHNHHNFAWEEVHDGQPYWVVRKGCTPAFPGQEGFVGSTMGEPSVILTGTEQASEAMFSTVHGAGRAMSRTKAAGKQKKRWACQNCGWVQPKDTHKPEDGWCPDCGRQVEKLWCQMEPGVINWQETLRRMEMLQVELRGGAADEAPGAYKRLPEVLAAHGDTIAIVETLIPVGVAMAPGELFDPYKD